MELVNTEATRASSLKSMPRAFPKSSFVITLKLISRPVKTSVKPTIRPVTSETLSLLYAEMSRTRSLLNACRTPNSNRIERP